MKKDLKTLALEVEAQYGADILVYFGSINRPWDDMVIDMCKDRKKRQNALLFLASYGGDAHAAYRIARCIRQNYHRDKINSAESGRVIIFVNSVCASAGTLITLASDRLILSEHAELGPLDVQLVKPDEVGERISGLTPIEAVNFLEKETKKFFAHQFEGLRMNRRLSFSTRMAAEISSQLASGLLAKLYEQIDPLGLAEYDRTNRIAEHYGDRIKSENVKPGTIKKLLEEYPSHECCIDPEEAKELFANVEQPTPELEALGAMLKPVVKKYLDSEEAVTFYLTEEENTNKPQPAQPHETTTKKDTVDANGGGGVAGEQKGDGQRHTSSTGSGSGSAKSEKVAISRS